MRRLAGRCRAPAAGRVRRRASRRAAQGLIEPWHTSTFAVSVRHLAQFFSFANRVPLVEMGLLRSGCPGMGVKRYPGGGAEGQFRAGECAVVAHLPANSNSIPPAKRQLPAKP